MIQQTTFLSLGWLKKRTRELDRKAVPNPGRVTVRRLNRYEYTNTVRDLLRLNFVVAEDFPTDQFGYGFNNIGEVLTLSPLLMEKYEFFSRPVAA